MDISIREFNKNDAFSIATIAEEDAVWGPEIEKVAYSMKEYDGKIVRCYIAEDNGLLVGFIYGFILPNNVLIPELLYVITEYRKNGIGMQLLHHLEQESDCSSSMIFYNRALHDYYAKQGYTTGDNLETAMKLSISKD